jgi:hypothetical protein
LWLAVEVQVAHKVMLLLLVREAQEVLELEPHYP